MSELMNGQRREQDIRWRLLSTVSAVALLAAVYGASKSEAADQDADRPTVWIELGGQFEQVQTEQQAFIPPFFAQPPSFTSIRAGQVQKPLDNSYGAEGKISFEPEGTDWVLSASIRYGRSNGSKHVHQSTKPGPLPVFAFGKPNGYYVTRSNVEFADAASKRSESQAIVDFQAGKDFGLGMFGNSGQSVVTFGVRFAQFHSALQASLGMDPDTGGYKYIGTVFKIPNNDPHTFLGSIQSTRSFQGLGPSVSWDGSAPFAGNSDRAEFTVDWSANAAILFGRQKTSAHNQTTAHSHPSVQTGGTGVFVLTVYHHAPPAIFRARSVMVPNVGGMAGVSLKFPNAKVSLGYRADFFFGAMDGGIDVAHKENIGFYGPFASVSVGIGG